MNLHLNPLYKKLLLLAIVLGPIVWLVFTEDGRRRTDLVVLYLFGKTELNLAIENLRGTMTEADFRALFPDLDLRCDDAANPFGDRLCTVEVGAFNAIPARAFTLFLCGDELCAAKLNYRRAYHETLQRQLTKRLRVRAEHTAEYGGAVSWPVSDGLLLMPGTTPESDSEAALMWVSAVALQQRIKSGG
ncbi:MAG: hypothetical protein U9Q81_08270 [Pseudomonadota bacterium]|nr:hypothetical protein [Pseudomonadota bacterium]